MVADFVFFDFSITRECGLWVTGVTVSNKSRDDLDTRRGGRSPITPYSGVLSRILRIHCIFTPDTSPNYIQGTFKVFLIGRYVNCLFPSCT